MRFELKLGDLLKQDVEVVVASANNDLILGGGETGEIRRSAGPSVLEECEAIGTIPLGQVAVTGAGELTFKHIFHAAIKPIGLFADAKSIRSAIRNCFREATKREITSIGFPAIGVGGGSFPIDKAVQILIEEALRQAKEVTSVERVVLALSDPKAMELIEPLVRERVPAEMLSPAPPPEKEPKIDPPSFGAR